MLLHRTALQVNFLQTARVSQVLPLKSFLQSWEAENQCRTCWFNRVKSATWSRCYIAKQEVQRFGRGVWSGHIARTICNSRVMWLKGPTLFSESFKSSVQFSDPGYSSWKGTCSKHYWTVPLPFSMYSTFLVVNINISKSSFRFHEHCAKCGGKNVSTVKVFTRRCLSIAAYSQTNAQFKAENESCAFA